MIFKNLLNTDLKVSAIALGAAGFSANVSEPLAYRLMDNFFEQGGNTIDTARMYAMHKPDGDGESERVIGRYLKQKNNRNHIVIVSKCSHPRIQDMTVSRLSAEEIESDIDTSLKALGTDHIDLLFLHRDDPRLMVDGIIDTLNLMVKKGKIRYFGASNWTGERLQMANDYARETNQKSFSASQIEWSAAKTVLHDKTLVAMSQKEYKFYKETKLPVFAFSSQARGFFTKYDNGEDALSPNLREEYLTEHNIEVYRRIKQLSVETGLSVTAITLSYITSNHDFDSIAIIGCKNLEQLSDSLSAQDVKLSQEQVEFINHF